MSNASAPSSPTDRKLFAASTAANDGNFDSQDWVLFVAVAAIWGSSFVFIDIGLDAFPPALITFLRIGSGALALFVVPKPDVKIASHDRVRLLLLSVVWVALPFSLFPLAQDHINSSVTGLLNGATPIFVAVVATVFLRQPPTGPLLVGILVGFVGITFISIPSIGDGSSQAYGVALVVTATVCYGFAINVAAPLQQRYGSLPLMARMLVLATIWTAPPGLLSLDEADWQFGPLVAVLVLGMLGTGIAFWIMGSLVGRVGSTRASFITYLIPVVSLSLGVLFRDDDVSGLALVGITLVIAGALLASRAKR